MRLIDEYPVFGYYKVAGSKYGYKAAEFIMVELGYGYDRVVRQSWNPDYVRRWST
jgi:hypothetical protein